MNIKKLVASLAALFLLAVATGCNDDGKAQENQFSESFSGSFVSASTVTDTNKDGVPANFGEFEGTSNFGPVTIESLNEFSRLPEPVTCPDGNIEFTLVQGHFVKRIENGDLLFGTWESGTSCFDPTMRTSSTTQNGNFSGGTGQFANVTGGPIEINFTSTFLAETADQGFNFGGSTGMGTGMIITGGQ